ncbi:hypothetical protein RvY_07558 [Ramazzottius varieornatus]|uniref:G-protein coupled receptors family 1 profile domain-containing protein n=1 Tax=Ramazzottius varieornatus TaxID=947166 RepID=A0A1D1V573_RAMVA|nr:hypothetical protein RvY_07558 [Ramazzottius varieornatus]
MDRNNLTAGSLRNTSGGSNATASNDDVGFYPNAEVAGWLLLVIGVGTVISNGIFLLTYCKVSSSSFHTPFNVYMLNLAITDFVTAIFTTPGNFALYALNKWVFSRAFCTVYLYGFWTWYSLSIQFHMLISLNRLWAVCFPMHYKTYHTKRLAALMCILTYIYAHIWTLTGLIPDDMYYRTENFRDCSLNLMAQSLWATLCDLILYVVPEVVVVGVYPIIGWKVAQRRKVRASARSKPGATLSAADGVRDRYLARPSASVGPQQRSRGRQNVPGSSTSQFKVLTYLVAATVIFWTPNLVYFAIASTSDYFDSTFYTITVVLLSINPLITPLTYPLASAVWREAFRSLLKPTG